MFIKKNNIWCWLILKILYFEFSGIQGHPEFDFMGLLKGSSLGKVTYFLCNELPVFLFEISLK